MGVCVGSAACALAAPPVTDGLQLLLDASEASSLATDELGRVSQWNDLSGGGHHAVQGTQANRPTYNSVGLNGRPSLGFSGSSILSTPAFMVFSNHTIFVVAQAATSGESDILGSGSVGADGDVLIMNYQNHYRGHHWTGGGAVAVLDSGLPSVLTPTIYEQVSGDTFMRIYRGVQLDNATATSSPHVSVVKQVSLGSRFTGGGPCFVGEMSEVLIYSRALSDAERSQVNSYLAAKWLIKAEGAPPVTAGLKFWTDASDTDSLVKDGDGKVSQWNNLTGLGCPAGQGTAAYQPTYDATGLNGKPALSFSGANALSTAPFMDFSNHTVFVVAQAAAFGGNDILGSGNITTNDVLLMNFGGRFRGHYWTDTQISADAWSSVRMPTLYEQTVDDATLRLHMNGVLAQAQAVTGPRYDSAKPVCLGDRSGTSGLWPFVGKMSEVLVFDRALTDSERGQVESYLVSKWSIGDEIKGLPPVTMGLQVWLDAGQASSLTQDENGKVSQWSDSTGLGHHAAQAAAGEQPTYTPSGIKGHPSLSFGGAAALATGDCVNFSNHTVFVVAKATVINAYRDFLGSGGTNPGDILMMNVAEGKYRGHYWAGSGILVVDSASPSVTAPTVYEQRLDDAGLRIYRNGVSDGAVADAGAARPTTLRPVVVGVRALSDFGDRFVGEMSEVLVYERALSDAERAQVERYLTAKWLVARPGTLLRVF